MDYLLDKYKRTFGEALTVLGYKRYNKTYYLPESDIVKKISLNRTKTNCALEYGIMPFCFPVDSKACLSGGRYFLIPPPDRIWTAWFFIENVPDKVDPVIEDMLRATKEYILPWFDKIHDCKDAYPEMIELEKKLLKGKVSMNDSVKVWICIKNGDYENAYSHMSAIVKQNEDAYRIKTAEFEKTGDTQARDAFLKSFLPGFQMLDDELHRISIPDVEYLQNIVAKNEAISQEFLKNPNRRK